MLPRNQQNLNSHIWQETNISRVPRRLIYSHEKNGIDPFEKLSAEKNNELLSGKNVIADINKQEYMINRKPKIKPLILPTQTSRLGGLNVQKGCSTTRTESGSTQGGFTRRKLESTLPSKTNGKTIGSYRRTPSSQSSTKQPMSKIGTTVVDLQNKLIDDIQKKIHFIQSQDISLKEACNQYCNAIKQCSVVEDSLTNCLLETKTIQKHSSNLLETVQCNLQSSNEKQKSNRLKLSLLTRDILQSDETYATYEKSLNDLNTFISSSKNKQLEAFNLIPKLKQSASQGVTNIHLLEDQLLNELGILNELLAKMHITSRNIRWICRLWNPNGPKNKDIHISVQPSFSDQSELNNSVPPKISEHDVSSPLKLTQPDCSILRDYPIHTTSSSTDSQQTLFNYKVTTRRIDIANDTLELTADNQNISLPVSGIPQSFIVMEQQAPTDIHLSQTAVCEKDSQSLYTACSVEVPFDQIIDCDPTVRPHGLMLTNWDTLDTSVCHPHDIEKEPIEKIFSNGTMNTNTSRYVLFDKTEQTQIVDSSNVLINEFLKGSSSSGIRPIALGLISIGVHHSLKQTPQDQTFWGGDIHSRIVRHISLSNVFEHPIIKSLHRTETHSKQLSSETSLSGILESGLQTVFSYKDEQNKLLQLSNKQTLQINTSLTHTDVYQWRIEASIIIVPSYPYVKHSSSSVQLPLIETSHLEHQQERITLVSHEPISRRRSLSSPNLHQPIESCSLMESLHSVLPNLSGLSGISLYRSNDDTIDQRQLSTLLHTDLTFDLFSVPNQQSIPLTKQASHPINPMPSSVDLPRIHEPLLDPLSNTSDLDKDRTHPMTILHTAVSDDLPPFVPYTTAHDLMNAILEEKLRVQQDIRASHFSFEHDSNHEYLTTVSHVPLHTVILIKLKSPLFNQEQIPQVFTILFAGLSLAEDFPSTTSELNATLCHPNERGYNLTDQLNNDCIQDQGLTEFFQGLMEFPKSSFNKSPSFIGNKKKKKNGTVLITKDTSQYSIANNLCHNISHVVDNVSYFKPITLIGKAINYFNHIIKTNDYREHHHFNSIQQDSLLKQGRPTSNDILSKKQLYKGGCLTMIINIHSPLSVYKQEFQLLLKIKDIMQQETH